MIINTFKRKIQLGALALLLLSVMVTYQNCSKVKLEPYKEVSYSVSKIGIDFCTTPADSVQSRLKFLFILDRSGSNKTRIDVNDPTITYPGTDPQGAVRFPNIVNFLNNFNSFNPADTYYSFMNFETNARMIKFGGQDYTNNKANFINTVESEGAGPDYTDAINPADGGGTNYSSALETAYNVIYNDIQKAKNDFATGVTKNKIASTYIIFFISDGEPIVVVNQAYYLQPLNEILSIVRRITDFQNTETDFVDGVSMNTAYYYTDPKSATAELYLREMAKEGFGTSLVFTNGDPIDYSQFSIPPRVVRFGLKELWLVNPNTIWDNDVLVPDADMDGISDEGEKLYGSNPIKYDSDGNGLGDGVELNLNGKPCALLGCAAQPTFPGCQNGWKSATHYSGFRDTDLDDLNDCEEVAMKSNIQDPDTNRDYIPDGLAMRARVKVVEASNASSLDPDFDGVSDYQEIKFNSPIDVHNADVESLKLTNYQGRMISSTVEQDCYRFDVFDMAFLKELDKLRLYIVEDTKSMNEKKAIRRAEVISNFGNVNVSEADFVKYQP